MKRGISVLLFLILVIVLSLNFISADLISHWSFDGNADDSSGSGNNGVVSGAILTEGKSNQAYKFDGINDYINIINEASFDFERTDKFSIALWLKPDSADTSTQVPISKMRDASPFTGWDFVINYKGSIPGTQGSNKPGYLTLQIVNKYSNNSIEVSTSSPTKLNDGNYHYYVITYDSSSSANGVKIYEDGEKLPLTITRDNLISSILNNYKVTLGDRDGGDTGFSYKGLIDEVKIFNRTFSDLEINGLYLSYLYQCNDKIDNDADGKIDYPSDPGCDSAIDNDESNVINATCTDSDGGKDIIQRVLLQKKEKELLIMNRKINVLYLLEMAVI